MKILKLLMFNRVVKTYLHGSPFNIFGLNKRLRAISTELLYTLSVFFPFLIILMIPSFIFQDPFQTEPTLLDILPIIPFGLVFIAIFNKDFFNGQSVVKRYLGYQVIDIKTLKSASHFKCMLRNITGPIWPVEVVFALANRQRRLGDFIAGTKVIEVEETEPEGILEEIKARKFDSTATLTLVVSVIVVIFYTLLSNPKFGLL